MGIRYACDQGRKLLTFWQGHDRFQAIFSPRIGSCHGLTENLKVSNAVLIFCDNGMQFEASQEGPAPGLSVPVSPLQLPGMGIYDL